MATQIIRNEIAVIGSLLIAPETLPIIESNGITPGDFQDPVCREVYAAALDCRDNGESYDLVVLGEAVKAKTGEDISSWIAEAMQTTPTANNVALYCGLVKRESKRRHLQELLEDASYKISVGDWTDEVDRIVTELNDIRSGNTTDYVTGERLAEGFLQYYKKTKENPQNAFCKTGFDELDWQFGGGMFRSEVYVIGARPGMGKTTLGINVAENVARKGSAVLFVSLEMTANQIMAKRIALEGGMEYTRIMSGTLEPEEEEKMAGIIEQLTVRPFYLTTRSGLTVGEIGKISRQITGLSLIIIDYMGLIPASEESRAKPRYEQMTEISAGIKALAKSLDVPIVALSQLNRENMTRKDKRPTLADLRDSGAIEQDAGAVILLHRPEYYESREQGDAAETEDIELNVAKNRHASPGLVHMSWHGGRGAITSKAIRPDETPDKVFKAEELPF